jgi:pimeloyl-ACP methyl ester carboxylesterase
MRFAASNVTGGIVPNSGHWIMEENPQATIKLITNFLAADSTRAKSGEAK